MDAEAPLPALADAAPSWDKAAALARDWDLNRLAQRLDELAVSTQPIGQGSSNQ